MGTFFKIIGGLLVAAFIFFLAPLIGISVGAFTGWVCGLFFDDTLRDLATRLGVDWAPWQLGAALGFVGSFFKSSQTNTNN